MIGKNISEKDVSKNLLLDCKTPLKNATSNTNSKVGKITEVNVLT